MTLRQTRIPPEFGTVVLTLKGGESAILTLEDKVVADELHAIGCDFVQGYAYDLPLRLQDIMVAFDPFAD